MLPFTAEILFSSFEPYNRALWPLPMVAPALALVILALALRPVRHGDRALGALLALAWLWVGLGYFILHFAAFDFVAPIYGAFFVLEALLLGWSAVVRGRLAFRFRRDLFGWCGLALAFAAALAWPLADALLGQDWTSVRVVGLAPGPTAACTLGMLLLCAGRTRLHLAVVPLLWTLIAGATAWILSIPQDLALPLAGIGAFALLLLKNRREKRA
jgi:Family of unknown function (DUF6064)